VTDREARILLACVGMHPGRLRSLGDRHGGASGVVAAIRRGFVDGIESGSLLEAERRLESVGATGARLVLLGDPDYPAVLAAIADPPDVLFVRGDLPAAAGVAVVGTRRCTSYGTRLAEAYGRAIAAAGWPLVSGLARGIDAAAHTGTVAASGIGVVVLGCGPDVVYPREHRRLQDALLELGGAVVTEYPPGVAPSGWRFPPRNRIISGLAAVVVVVEAALTGGALVTAARAIEQGRAVFAVPGDVDREASAGCNRLIRDGAVPVFDAEDLVEALGLVLGPPRRPRAVVADPVPDDAPDLVGPEGTTLDDLGARLGVDGPALLTLVGRLELDGTIRREGAMILPGH
jgi:DNA processing protein